MPYFVYILYSERIDKYYVGKSENPNNRLNYHNSDNNRIWTKRGKPWESKTSIEFENEAQATKAERFIKKQKSRKFIEKIISEGWKSI
ncbi:MAG: GIY-YIG nuclease family protein [Vicingaceae bacterium]